NYGVIGDLYTVALVGMDGSFDFFAFPHFDSPTVFAALLDHVKGGRFQIAPQLANARQKQLYLPDSNILLTRFLAPDGVAEISDFMPVEEVEQAHNLVRRVKTVRGELCFRMLCAPRFDYGRAAHRVEQQEGTVLFASEGNDRTALRLHSSVPLRIQNGDAIAEFTLRPDEHAEFVLEWALPGKPSLATAPDYVSRCFKDTVNFWRRWIGHSTYQGRWLEMVNRAALSLKLLVSQPYGSLVAAPTFGLPEHIGGERNWDYRYTWIRDASFTLYALIRLGYTDEAGAFMRWIEPCCRTLEPDGSLQVLYGIDGRRFMTEEFLPHLEGWGHTPDQMYCDIFTHFWDEQRHAFVQYKGAQTLDAATLLMPLMRFISPIEPRWLSTLRAIEEVLVSDSLVYRYKTDDAFYDGFVEQEGTFSMCSFWYVECLARSGDLEKARF